MTVTADPVLLARLPEVFNGSDDDGYSFMTHLDPAWQPVSHWGHGGWCLGSWPHVIVCHYNNPAGRLFGVLTYADAELDIRAYRSRHQRDTATDTTAAWCWRHAITADRPTDLPPAGTPLPPAHRGPHQSPRRAVVYAHAPTGEQAAELLRRGRDRAAYWHYSIVGEFADHDASGDTQLAAALAAVTTGAARILLTPALAVLADDHTRVGEVVAGLRAAGGRAETFVDTPDPRGT